MKNDPNDTSRRALEDDLAKLDGRPPYDTGSNICRSDAYFARSLEKKYGGTIEEFRKMVPNSGGLQ